MIPNKNNYNKTQLLLLCSAMMCGSAVFSLLEKTPAKGSMSNIITSDMIINACKSNVTDDSDAPFKGFQGAPSNEEGAFMYASSVELGKLGLNADKNKYIEAVKAIFANKDVSDFIDADRNGFYAAMTADRFDDDGNLKTDNPLNRFINNNVTKYAEKIATTKDKKILTSLNFKKYTTLDYISKMLANIIDTCDVDDKDILKTNIQKALDNLDIDTKTTRREIRTAVIAAVGASLDGKILTLKKINSLFGYTGTDDTDANLKADAGRQYNVSRSYFEGTNQDATLAKEFCLDGSIDLSDGNTLVKLAALNLINPNGFFTEDMIKSALTKGVGTETSLLKDGNIVTNYTNFVTKVSEALNNADQDTMKNNLNIQFTLDDYKTLVNCALAYNSDDVLPDFDGKSIFLPRNESKFSISVAEFVKSLNGLYGTLTAGEKDVSFKDLKGLTRNSTKLGGGASNVPKLISDQILNAKIKLNAADNVPNYYVETLLLSAFFDLLGAQPDNSCDKINSLDSVVDSVVKAYKDATGGDDAKLNAAKAAAKTAAKDAEPFSNANIDACDSLGALETLFVSRDGIYETRGDKGKRETNNPRKRDLKNDNFILDGFILHRSLSLFSAGSDGKGILNSVVKTNSVGDVARALSTELIKQIDKGAFDFKNLLEAIRKAADYIKNGGVPAAASADVTTESAKEQISAISDYLTAETLTKLNETAVSKPKEASGKAKSVDAAVTKLNNAITKLTGRAGQEKLLGKLQKFLEAVKSAGKGFNIENPEGAAIEGAESGFPKLSELLSEVNALFGEVSKEQISKLVLEGITDAEVKKAAEEALGRDQLTSDDIKLFSEKGILNKLVGLYVPKDLTKPVAELKFFERLSLAAYASSTSLNTNALLENLSSDFAWHQRAAWRFFRAWNFLKRKTIGSLLSVQERYVPISEAKAWSADAPAAAKDAATAAKAKTATAAKGGA